LFNALSRGKNETTVSPVRSRRIRKEEDVQKASLSTTLDELIGLRNELLSENPVGKSRLVGDLLGFRVPRDLLRRRGRCQRAVLLRWTRCRGSSGKSRKKAVGADSATTASIALELAVGQ
jgi:hypothetical protein